MREKNWQVSIIVKGLHAPEEGIVCDGDIIVKPYGEADEAEVLMKITENDAKGESHPTPFQRALESILHLYGLETRIQTIPSLGYASAPITKKRPFGRSIAGKLIIRRKTIYPTDKSQKLSSAFKFAVREYKIVHRIFEDSSKAFIRHGLAYYYTALGERDIEKKVIDLVVALESLFSKEPYEIRFKVSIRTGLFLGFIGIETGEVYETVHDLYPKRSRIVHGVHKVDVSWEEVHKLERYLRDCFRIFLYLDKGKDDIISMLDVSIYDNNVKQELQKIIVDAYDKWKTERSAVTEHAGS